MREKLLNMSTWRFMALWIVISAVLGIVAAVVKFIFAADAEWISNWFHGIAMLQWWGGIIWYFTSRPSRK
jgi:hypothetical protein